MIKGECKGKRRRGVGLIIAPGRLTDLVIESYIDENIIRVDTKMWDEIVWFLITDYVVNEYEITEDKDKLFNLLCEEADRGENIFLGDLNGSMGKNHRNIESDVKRM